MKKIVLFTMLLMCSVCANASLYECQTEMIKGCQNLDDHDQRFFCMAFATGDTHYCDNMKESGVVGFCYEMLYGPNK